METLDPEKCYQGKQMFMGFIKDALIGILLYEGLKCSAKSRGQKGTSASRQIMLGGKNFQGHGINLSAGEIHRHHLDRPEMGHDAHS